MSGYFEKMTEADIWQEIDREFHRWNELANGVCQDPFWPDGMNMNLVRNHIICWYKELADRNLIQLNLFGDIVAERPIPPKVPVNYMVRDGAYSHRLDGRRENLVWGRKGQYHA